MDDVRSMRRRVRLAILASAVGAGCGASALGPVATGASAPEAQARPSQDSAQQDLRFSELKDCLYALDKPPPRMLLTPAEVRQLTEGEGSECAPISVVMLEAHIGRVLPGRNRRGSSYSYRIELDERASTQAREAGSKASCIYQIRRRHHVGKGRPMLAGGQPILASRSRSAPHWPDVLKPLLPSDPELRQLLADSWLHDARLEHSSIAEFSRLVGVLMSLSAPPALIEDTLLAAQDELQHARLCFSLASAYAGVPQGPGGFPQHQLQTDRHALALETFRQGCVGETVAALEAASSARLCDDPVVQQVLETIARDEERHALLAWRVLSWLLSSASGSERGRLLEVLQQEHEQRRPVAHAPAAPDGRDLSRWGVLGAKASLELEKRSWEDIVTPSWTLLLSRMQGVDDMRPAVAG